MNPVHIFAQISPPELTSILALFIGMLTGFYALVKYMLNRQDKQQYELLKVQQLDREERMALTKAFTRVAEATELAAREAKERNGHLAELQLQSQETFKALSDRNYDAITHIKNQHVTKQIVENEQVVHKES